jgi:prolyl-tRNA editing enzyme YbaK/EbsC (Cys-tRNA(Pro) deacylase)
LKEAVRAALERAGVAVDERHFPEGTRTAQDAAAAVGVEVGQIVKSLVFAKDSPPGIVLVLTSGANRVDEARLEELLGEPVGRADAARVREVTSFAIGGVPPVGHPQPLPTVVDEDLLGYDVVWAAAGTPVDVFAIAPDDLVRASGGRVARVTPGS